MDCFTHLKATGNLYLFDPANLSTFEQQVEWLEAILHGPCYIWEEDGEETLIFKKAAVDRINGLTIHIYSDEHPPPHFHVRTREINASFRIDNCELLENGAAISRRDRKKVEYWYRAPGNKERLEAKWADMRETGCTVDANRPDPAPPLNDHHKHSRR